MLERRFIDIWVEGELSNYKASTAGHLYFTLKDDRAQLSAVCFRNAGRLLRFGRRTERCSGRADESAFMKGAVNIN
jgi:exonuclease VII large subunit